MPNYASLNSQIDAVKSEITASLGVGTYTAQDLVFVASALKTLGAMLGIDDIVQATSDAQDTLSDLVGDILAGTAPAIANKLFIGPDADQFETDASLTNAIAVFRKHTGTEDSSFAQIAFVNDDATSSTDLIVYANNGTDVDSWAGVGITGNDFDDATYGITGPNDAYIFASPSTILTKSISQKGLANNTATLTTSTAHGFTAGKKVKISNVDSTFNGTYTINTVPTPTTFTYNKTYVGTITPVAVSPVGTAEMYTGAGNLVLATANTGYENKIIIAAGGYSSGDTQIAITPGQNVHVEIPTESTSSTTGAITVVGGVGIQGDLNIAGDVAIQGTITFGGGGTTVETSNLAVTDPAIFVATDNTANIVDFSFIGEYDAGGPQKYSAISKDATDGVWKFSSGISTKPTTTINYNEVGVVYDTVQLGGIVNTGTTSLSGNLNVNTDKFQITASNGNTLIAGSVTAPDFIITGTVDGDTDATSVSYVWGALAGNFSTKTANYNLVNRDNVYADTTASVFTLTLPASPAVNNRIRIADLKGTWGSNPPVLARNGNKINGLNEDYILNLRGASVELVYSGSDQGWKFL